MIGSVRTRGDRCQVRWRAAGRETSRTFENLEQAEAFRRELSARSAQSRDALAWGGELGLADIAQMWAADRGFRERTLRTNEAHLRNHILPVLGDGPVGEIARPVVHAWLAELDLAPATRQRVLGIVRQVLRYALDHGFVDADPTVGLRVPGAHRRRGLALPTVDVLEALRDEIDPRFAVAIDAMGYAGASISELAAMRVCDLDFSDRMVAIHRSVELCPDGSRTVSDGMKTETRDRVVPVVPERVWCRWEPLGDRDPAERLVASPRGGLLHPSNFRNRVFEPAVARTQGCPRSLTPHGLRHFACSLWLAARCSEYDVADWAGHTDIGLIGRTYGHALPRSGSELEVSTLESVLAQRSRPRLRS